MKRLLTFAFLTVMAARGWSQSSQTNSYTITPGELIPDGSAVGLSEAINVSGLTGGINDVQVSLDISGGFNGDLYAYLVDPTGNMAVLLNRVGVSGSNPVGYGDAGFNITLDQNALNGNIHDYQTVVNPDGGALTGIWAPDGRAIDPQSSGSAFDTASTGAGLNVYNGVDGTSDNGMWTLFIADLGADGSTATLNQVQITIMTAVPEPETWVMIGGGLAALLMIRHRRLSA